MLEKSDAADISPSVARVRSEALVSVGVDNDYGHPAEGTLAALAASGARVLRTDLDGDLVVVERDGRLAVVTGP